MNKILRYTILLSIVVISFSMHFKHFSKDLMSIHVWRQSLTQSNIINFYEEDMNILNPRRNERGNTDGIYRMEFPLMQWLVACSYKIFGNHLIVCRFFMFIIGLISILGMYKLLYVLFNNQVLALIGAWAFNFSPSFYYYTINPLPDNLALCCSIWGMALFFVGYRNERLKYFISSGILLSIGALCKLPFIIYFIVPALYFIIILYQKGINKKVIMKAFGIFGFCILPILWYFVVINQWRDNMVIWGVLKNQDSFMTILDYLQHNLISNLPELLLNYGSVIFFLSAFYFLLKRKAYRNSKFPLILSWSIVVLIYYLYEINAIAKIHDYYLFPFFPLLFILVAYGAYNLLNAKITFFRYLTIILLLLLPVFCAIRMHIRWNPESPGLNKDLLIYKYELQNAVPKNSLVVTGNDESHSIMFYYIDKKGWSYNNDNLTVQRLKTMIEEGAEYLYTDSKRIENNEEIMNMTDTLVLNKGSVSIYKLKKSS